MMRSDVIMMFLETILIMAAGYYSLTYGISLWKTQNSRLSAFGVILITVIGTVAPIVFLFIKA